MSSALAIFARFPRLGQVKTRLKGDLGEEGCLALHLALLLDTLNSTESLKTVRFLYLADCSEEEGRDFVRLHQLPDSLKVRLQRGTDLGERLWNAYSDLNHAHDKICLIGSDSPSLPNTYLEQAFAALERFAVVLGPVEDGGYYLLGLSQPRKELFRQMPWGTDRLLEATRTRLAPSEYLLLPAWYDVDSWADVGRLAEECATASGTLRHSLACLKKLGFWNRQT